MTLVAAVAAELTAAGLCSFLPDTVGGDCFTTSFPPTPDDALLLTGAGGATASIRLGYDEPAFQARARAIAADDAEDRLVAVYGRLHGFRGDLPDGTRVIRMWGVQSRPAYMGYDDSGRHEFAINFACEVRALTEHRT